MKRKSHEALCPQSNKRSLQQALASSAAPALGLGRCSLLALDSALAHLRLGALFVLLWLSACPSAVLWLSAVAVPVLPLCSASALSAPWDVVLTAASFSSTFISSPMKSVPEGTTAESGSVTVMAPVLHGPPGNAIGMVPPETSMGASALLEAASQLNPLVESCTSIRSRLICFCPSNDALGCIRGCGRSVSA